MWYLKHYMFTQLIDSCFKWSTHWRHKLQHSTFIYHRFTFYSDGLHIYMILKITCLFLSSSMSGGPGGQLSHMGGINSVKDIENEYFHLVGVKNSLSYVWWMSQAGHSQNHNFCSWVTADISLRQKCGISCGQHVSYREHRKHVYLTS